MSKITIYGKKSCARCKMVCDILNKKEIKYTYIDVLTLDEKDSNQILQEAEDFGITGLPIIKHEDKIIKDISEALK